MREDIKFKIQQVRFFETKVYYFRVVYLNCNTVFIKRHKAYFPAVGRDEENTFVAR